MKRCSLLLFFCSLFFFNLQSQDKRNQAFFVEIFGNGLTVSANYDTRFSNKPDGWGGRIGIGYVSADGTGILSIPILINKLLGKDDKYFEVGAGVTIVGGDDFDFEGEDFTSVLGTLTFMYRKQPSDGGFMWKIGLTPVFNGNAFIPYWFGVGLGYSW